MATPAEHKAAERLEKRESVQFALDQARGEESPAPPRAQAVRRDRTWLTGWLAVLAVTAVVSFLAWRQWLPLAPDGRDLLLRVTRGVMLAAGILAAAISHVGWLFWDVAPRAQFLPWLVYMGSAIAALLAGFVAEATIRAADAAASV